MDREFVVLPGQYHGYDVEHHSCFWRKVAAFPAANLAGPVT
ncbi:hypothetical protein [Streptomyces bullii]|uniref:Uncharacterized protein n=1 Tax=Streptomyces bullii TaxID=349910 RepID=A0ABW0UZ21_9ACTN